MPAQNKKAIDARRWRASATEKRRFNKVLNAYIHTKHNNIYQEVKQIYGRLGERYPNKNDLTKTTEWKTWKMTNSEGWEAWNNNAHTTEESRYVPVPPSFLTVTFIDNITAQKLRCTKINCAHAHYKYVYFLKRRTSFLKRRTSF